MPKCQAPHIVCDHFNKIIFALLDVLSLPLQKCHTFMDVFLH